MRRWPPAIPWRIGSRRQHSLTAQPLGRIGAQPFELLKTRHLSDVLVLSEDRICTTMIEMLNVEGIVLEPAGALAIEAVG